MVSGTLSNAQGQANAYTPMALVLAVVRAYSLRGMDPTWALSKAQITPLDAHNAQGWVTALQFERLCAAAMQELDDEALGWFSRRLPWGSYGMLARASISAPTLGVALKRWCRHHGLLTGDVTITIGHADGQARAEIAERGDIGALREFALLSLLRNLHGLACWLVDSHIALQGAQFPFAEPPHVDVYRRLFPGPVRFSAPGAALLFDAQYLQLPLRQSGAALDQMLRRALPILVWPYRRDRLLSRRVRRLLEQPNAAHTAETLAMRLGVSARSLHRQLRAEGTSLQALKDEVRRERASELLLRGTQPIKQIAHAAGFASDKSFLRAFRGWTGQTPEQFRAAGGSAATP